MNTYIMEEIPYSDPVFAHYDVMNARREVSHHAHLDSEHLHESLIQLRREYGYLNQIVAGYYMHIPGRRQLLNRRRIVS